MGRENNQGEQGLVNGQCTQFSFWPDIVFPMLKDEHVHRRGVRTNLHFYKTETLLDEFWEVDVPLQPCKILYWVFLAVEQNLGALSLKYQKTNQHRLGF